MTTQQQHRLLTETIPLVMAMEESAGAVSGRPVFYGRVGTIGTPTLNKRRYSESLMRRELGKVAEAMQRRRLLGELDHPDDGRTRLTRVSHLITDLRIEGTDLVARFEPLDTPNGRILEALGRQGVQVGASIRGWGSTRFNKDDGVEDVGDDYSLKCFDVVYEPADASAYPAMVAEAIEAARAAEEGMDESGVAAAVAEAEAKVEKRLREQFSIGVRKLAEKLAAEAQEHARSEALSDPAIAAIRPVVEQIAHLVAPWVMDVNVQEALAAKDADVQRLTVRAAALEKAVNEAEQLAREAAYHVVIERSLRGETAETRDAVINLVGDVKMFENREALEERLRVVIGQLSEARSVAVPTHGKTADVAGLEESLKKAAAEKAELRKISEDALAAAEKALIEGYVMGVASRHPKGDALIPLCASVSTIAQAKEVIARLDEDRRVSGGDDDLAEKIRRRRARGIERDLKEDTDGPAERPRRSALPPLPGVDWEEIRRKSGIA